VPTQAERNGDFSALLAINPNYQLYNPYSATLDSNKNVKRNPIPGNVFANAGLSTNPVAQAYLKLIPLPNYNGAATRADGYNNYFASDPTHNNYKSHAGRIDYNISTSNKLFGELHRSTNETTQSDVFHNPLTGTTSRLALWGGSLDDVENFNPTTNLDMRLGFSRSEQTSNPKNVGTDPSTFGFPSYISGNSALLAIPRITFTSSSNIPSLSATPGNRAFFNTIQLFGSFNKTIGHHTIKIGPDIRLNKNTTLSPGNSNGNYSFNASATDFVTSGTQGSLQPFGNEFATFLLGLPSGGSYDINSRFQYNNWYASGFIQDDWKVRHNLTLSLGLRIEHETPLVESNNKMTIGWDPTVTNATTAGAKAAYAAHPLPNNLLPASQFSPTGGLFYAGDDHRHAYSTAPVYVGPRLGITYSPDFSHGKMAIRLGYGIFVNPLNDYYSSQTYGFSQTTNMIISTNNNLTPSTTIADPFPTTSNPIQQPAGSSMGINTNLGNKIVYYAPNTKVAYAGRTSVDIQQQFGHNWMLEVGYINTHQVHQYLSNTITNGSGAVPYPYLSQSRYFDPVLNELYNRPVTNPYKGLIPGPSTSLNSSGTVPVSTLLWPNSEYSSVTEQLIPVASANYNALMVRVAKRMSNGLNLNVNYTYSRNLGAQSQIVTGGPLWYGETSSDFPHSLHVTALYMLPFGKGRMFLNSSPKLVDEFIGGWELTSIFSFDSGTALSWGNMIYNGNWHDFNNSPHNPQGSAFNTSVFDTRTCVDPSKKCDNTIGSATFNPSVQPNGYNNRTFPLMALRGDSTNNWDFSVLKNFQIWERVQVQPRIDAFNAFNRPQFSNANTNPTSSAFGTITGQQNTGRQLQGGIHILF